jgi:hypothetical protein
MRRGGELLWWGLLKSGYGRSGHEALLMGSACRYMRRGGVRRCWDGVRMHVHRVSDSYGPSVPIAMFYQGL